MKRLNETWARREFLRNGARYGALAAMATVTALLVRRGIGGRTGKRCISTGICPGCPAFSACGLPRALSARRATQNGA